MACVLWNRHLGGGSIGGLPLSLPDPLVLAHLLLGGREGGCVGSAGAAQGGGEL